MKKVKDGKASRLKHWRRHNRSQHRSDVIKHISHTDLTSTSKFKDGLQRIKDGKAFKMFKIKDAETFANGDRLYITNWV